MEHLGIRIPFKAHVVDEEVLGMLELHVFDGLAQWCTYGALLVITNL